MKPLYYLTISLVFLSAQLRAQCERQSAVEDYNTNYLPSSFNVNDLNWTGNLNTCTPGTISNVVQNKMRQRINYFRRLVGVADNVVFSSTLNQKSQKAAVMQEANNSLSHCTGQNGAPCNTWNCSNADAIEASQSSNLAWGSWNFSNPIDLYMEDAGASNTAVGHRRWLLYSKATTFGNGMTPNREVLWVFGNGGNPSVYNQFIAYPPANYIPAPLVYARWSFGIPGANFTNATVTIKNEAGASVNLTVVHKENTGYGDRTIVWEPTNIVKTSPYDVKYTVTVSNIQNAPQSSYTYTVTIIQPTYPPACPSGKTWSETACACQDEGEQMMITGVISSGTYSSTGFIQATGTISPGATVTFEAGQGITLGTGFSAAAGSTFLATITPSNAAPLIVATRERSEADGILNEPPLETVPFYQASGLPLQLNVAPNPAFDHVNVQLYLPTATEITLALFDITGRKIKEVTRNQLYDAGTQNYSVNVSDVLPGTYYLQLVTKETQLTEKLMIIRN